jgi:threonine/homoserine/homoserine lactone efflux protein
MEYPYAWIAVTFEKMILSSEAILQNFQLISAVVLTVLGILNLMSVNKPSKLTERFSQSGFRRGLVLGLLNPLAIPYWIGTTAFMEAQGWINLKSMVDIQSYLVGVVLGAITLLTVVTYLARRLGQALQHNKRIRMIPGIVLISLGLYAFARMLF